MSVEVRIASLLRVAAEDLAGARMLALGGNRNAVYLAEQAAEKIIRAVLTSESIHPGIKHDLESMVTSIPDANPLKPRLRDVQHLKDYATAFRYPTQEGRIKPLPADIAESLGKVQAALDDAVARFGVDVAAGNCTQCPSDRSTPSGLPHAFSSGLAELPGNDFIISMSASFDNPLGSVAKNPFAEGGPAMHELGHNLGLHHAGDVVAPESAPNYLSVMNPKYVFSGIQHAATPGSSISVESLRTLDYSEHELATLVESALSESSGVFSLSSNYTGIVRFVNGLGNNGSGPEAGPIDWSGDGSIDVSTVAVDLNLLNGTTETMAGYRDWDHSALGGGACVTRLDCRINAIRQQIHDLVDPEVDPHESCVAGSCQSLILPFQCFKWGKADAPPPPRMRRVLQP